jgi:hypothetical protein
MTAYEAGQLIGRVLLVILLIFGVRRLVFGSKAKRVAKRGARGVAPEFHNAVPRAYVPAVVPANSLGTPTAPGWYADPFGHAAHRWWSGMDWTDHVS